MDITSPAKNKVFWQPKMGLVMAAAARYPRQFTKEQSRQFSRDRKRPCRTAVAG